MCALKKTTSAVSLNKCLISFFLSNVNTFDEV